MKSFSVATLLLIAVGVSAAEAPVVSSPLAMAELPADSRDWDTVGCFTLRDATTTTTIWLYHSNENTIERKKADRAGENSCRYTTHPSCAFHAIYRTGDGPWKYQEVYTACRLGVQGVGEIRSETVQIRLCSLVIRRLGDPEPEPWTRVLKIIDGVPVLDADNMRKP